MGNAKNLKTRLGTEVINKLWFDFIEAKGAVLYTSDYNRVPRRGGAAREFESWLYSQGCYVVQENHKRYLEFINEDQATFFMLKYA